LHELRGDAELRLPEVLARLSPCDLVLVEGYKRHALPKLGDLPGELGKPLLHPRDAHIVGLATDTPAAFAGGRIPVFGLDAYDALATFVEERAVYATAGG